VLRGRRVIRESAVTPALSGQPANGDRQVMLVRQARRGRKVTWESGERPV
ncbi:phage tail protein, partial [Escherichia coli]|nr:phage tail protein [Escherichia coli]